MATCGPDLKGFLLQHAACSNIFCLLQQQQQQQHKQQQRCYCCRDKERPRARYLLFICRTENSISDYLVPVTFPYFLSILSYRMLYL